jgi:hypothetical protein
VSLGGKIFARSQAQSVCHRGAERPFPALPRELIHNEPISNLCRPIFWKSGADADGQAFLELLPQTITKIRIFHFGHQRQCKPLPERA